MVTFGIGETIQTLELRVVASVVIAILAFTLGYLVRQLRHRLVDRVHPILVDFATSVLLVVILIVTTLTIADLWQQTDAFLDQLGFLSLESRASQVTMTVVVIVSIHVLMGIVARLLDDLTGERGALTVHQREIVLRTVQLIFWLTGLIVILGIWAIDLTGLLVGAGFLGIVVGLAARQTIGSLLAGFVLMFSRPFEVGDWIAVGEFEGIVSEITMMSTRLSPPNGEYVVVPNDVITTKTVVNRTRHGRLRVDVDVGVDYDTDIEHARAIARDVAASLAADSARTQGHPAPDVLIRQFGDSAVLLTVRIWVTPPEPGVVNAVRDDLVAGIKESFAAEGIKIPYPQREISGRAETGGFRIARTEDSASSTEPAGEDAEEPST